MAMEHMSDDGDEAFSDADVEVTTDDEMESFPTMGSEPKPDNFDNNRLERCGRWLLSIPRDDVIVLRQTPEYQEFLQAFDRLGHAHRRVIAMNRNRMDVEPVYDGSEQIPPGNRLRTISNFSFLQHLAVDDVILRVFEFLECDTLLRTSETCSRFRELAHRSATQRTHHVAQSRQLNNVMKLLRAKEQIDGVGHFLYNCHVRVPMLLLSRRLLVSNAGDPEYNGVYFCTSSNGNGFVFTKPRFPEQRVVSVGTVLAPPPPPPMHGEGGVLPPVVPFGQPAQNIPTVNDEEDVTHPRQLLRCVIAKRFSNEVSARNDRHMAQWDRNLTTF